MDEENFFENDMSPSARRFEEMYNAGGEVYMDAEELEDLAEYYIGRKEFRLALRVIQTGIEKFPFESVFKMLKAEVLATTINYRPALELLDDILLYEPLNTDALSLKADVLLALGKFNEALECLYLSLPFTEETAPVKAAIYRSLLLAGKEEEARNFLTSAFDEEDDQELYNEFNYLFANPELEHFALSFYEWYTDQYPYKAQGWLGLGRAYAYHDNHTGCITACDYAIAIDKEERAAYFLRSQSAIELEQYEQAIEDLEYLIEKDGEDDFLYCRLASCYVEKDELGKARKYFRKALKIDSESIDAWYGLAMCYKQEGKFKEALHFVEKAISLDAYSIEYQMDKAEMLIGLGKFEDALQIYHTLTDESPADEEIWLNMATLHAEMGDFQEGLDVLYEALDYCPETAAISYRLASYHFMLGETLEGIEYLEKALDQKFEDHFLLFLHAPELQEIGTIWEIIDVYRNENQQT